MSYELVFVRIDQPALGKVTSVLVPGARFPLELNRAVEIGRSATVEISVGSGSVARRHARVCLRRDDAGDVALDITDLGSTNGTYVRGHSLTEDRISVGEEFSIAGLIFLLSQV